MADGLNQARAMRVAEIIDDFRSIQHFLASIRANPSAHVYYEEGYAVLRQCASDSQALLSQPFDSQAFGPHGDEEEKKSQLRRVILDASVRRFEAQRIYLRASAALRWAESRNAILRGNLPQMVHQPALNQILNTLRAELCSITTERVELSLRSKDISQGKWVAEDPGLQIMYRLLRTDH
ncbi:hypothetical protein AAFC00_001718 [Neodothiora populina]|uniref:Uncharacterized protein n=1 Tax=Neodothiora populina TaxID=2781224 RepID=A0ABR3PQ57_9PEZI